MLVSSFGLSTSFLAALRAIGSMGKRPQDQGSTSSKRSTPTRPATEQTPEIPADAEATMHDPGKIYRVRRLRARPRVAQAGSSTDYV